MVVVDVKDSVVGSRQGLGLEFIAHDLSEFAVGAALGRTDADRGDEVDGVLVIDQPIGSVACVGTAALGCLDGTVVEDSGTVIRVEEHTIGETVVELLVVS